MGSNKQSEKKRPSISIDSEASDLANQIGEVQSSAEVLLAHIRTLRDESTDTARVSQNDLMVIESGVTAVASLAEFLAAFNVRVRLGVGHD
jgi:uncharacterized protein YlxW (UPF0749 family)